MIESPVLSEGMHAGEPDNETTALVLYSDNEEAVEWLNMCWRKVGRQLSDMCVERSWTPDAVLLNVYELLQQR